MNNSEAETLQDSLILVVDDVLRNVRVIADILTQRGFKVAMATNGDQALRFLKKRIPDLILLDVMMPEMSGFEVCERIKENAETRNIPVIFLTAKTEIEDKIRGFEIGGADYVIKPFEPAEVVARVKTHLALKQAQETIEKYNTQLEQMLEDRTKELIVSERQAAFGQMIQGIVHNMNNPLMVIQGTNELLKMELENIHSKLDHPSFETISGNIESIGNAGKKLTDMVSSLMAKSRSDKVAEVEETDLNKLIDQEIEFLQADLSFKSKIEKYVELSSQSIIIKAIPGEIAQIFQNIIRNAIHALYDHPSPEIQIKSWQDKASAYFSITDNGPGIPEENLSKLFDPFFTTKPKADSEDSDKPRGTGLGLHYCQEMTKNYNGEITVESEVGKGTTFTVMLPLSE